MVALSAGEWRLARCDGECRRSLVWKLSRRFRRLAHERRRGVVRERRRGQTLSRMDQRLFRTALRGQSARGEGLPRPSIEGDWPYLWIDATYEKVRQQGCASCRSRSASTAMADAKFSTAFLRKLVGRGLRGEGIKRMHFMRNVLAHVGKRGRRVVSAFIATAFPKDDGEAAQAQWRKIADQLRPQATSSPTSSKRLRRMCSLHDVPPPPPRHRSKRKTVV
ncbi:hypothetical protein ACVIYL_004615 [Bradyrhizobium sp. USDA 3315]